MNDTLLVAGTLSWFLVNAIEYTRGFHEINKNAPEPCMIHRIYASYNVFFVGFPIILIAIAEMHIINSAGAMGLTLILEFACILGIHAYDSIKTIHIPLCIIAGASATLNCLNLQWQYGAFVGIPLLLGAVMAILMQLLWFPDRDETHQHTAISCVLGFLDAWMILSRLILLKDWSNLSDKAKESRFNFDVFSFLSLLYILSMLCIIAVAHRRK